ncbi:1-acyl-sn-glycerol-3-phosphate acyltransferase [bacterium]|nr:1-acyl-sn-glycerol-3-phosphate acyltransferase [bacterium]
MKKIGLFFLNLIKPFFTAYTARRPDYVNKLKGVFVKDPYFSGMVQKFNFWHRLIFSPYFNKVNVDPIELNNLKKLSETGTLVYIMKNQGQLEYSYFNHLFIKENIPLAHFANSAHTLYWRKFSDFRTSLAARLNYYYERGLLEDPLNSGFLEYLIANGNSPLLNLRVSRELIFGNTDDPIEFIPPLIKAARKSLRPVYLVTQQFLYSRHPEKENKSIIDALFGEKTNPGRFRKFVMFLFLYRKKATVKFGEALNLKDFIAQNPDDDDITLSSKLKNILMERLMVERRSITGPALVKREKLLDKMLRNKNFKDDLEKLCLETGQKREDIEKTVHRYFMEIAADFNYNYVDFYSAAIHWMTKNIYDGLDIDTEGLSRIKKIAGKYPIILVPSHKSHIDYLLLSYIFYNYDLTMPHICAGINLKFWPVTNFVRHGGGFYIRRTIGGNKTYKLVLEHYLKLLMREGYTMEFFIEGTRSRTGKLLKPKMGILSMLMQGYLDGATPDAYFVPISIHYERIMEQKSYMSELKGAEKEKENVVGIIKAGDKFNKKYGKVFIRFAEPVSLKSFLDEKNILPENQNIDEHRRAVEQFAYKMTYDINRVSVVTSTSLVATALLSFNEKGILSRDLFDRIRHLKNYLDYKGARLTDVVRLNETRAYQDALSKLSMEKTISHYRDFEEEFYTLDTPKRMMLDYHKNTALHFYVSLACVSKILENATSNTLTLEEIKKKYEMLKTLLRHDFTFSERTTLEEHILKVIRFYEQEKLLTYNPDTTEVCFDSCRLTSSFYLFSSLLDDFFEASLITLTYIKNMAFEQMDQKKLELDILAKGHLFYLKGALHYSESLSQSNIHNALTVYKDLGLIKADDAKLVSRNYDEQTIIQWENILKGLLKLTGAKKTLPPIQQEVPLLPEPTTPDLH